MQPLPQNRCIDVALLEEDDESRKNLVSGLTGTHHFHITWDGVSPEGLLAHCSASSPTAVWFSVGACAPHEVAGTLETLQDSSPLLSIVLVVSVRDIPALIALSEVRLFGHVALLRRDRIRTPACLSQVLRDTCAGHPLIDADVAGALQRAAHRSKHCPLTALSVVEKDVLNLMAAGMTNEDIASTLGLPHARAVSRINGRIYQHCGLDGSGEADRVARTRATLIYLAGEVLQWDPDGLPRRCACNHGKRDVWTPGRASLWQP